MPLDESLLWDTFLWNMAHTTADGIPLDFLLEKEYCLDELPPSTRAKMHRMYEALCVSITELKLEGKFDV